MQYISCMYQSYKFRLTPYAPYIYRNAVLVPLMPSSNAACAMLVARFCISQMDVPARQSYVAMVVASDERSAAAGITNVARSVGMLIAPAITGYLSSATPGTPLFNSPWYIAGGLKVIYDLTLWCLYHLSTGLKDAEASIDKKNDVKEPLLKVEEGDKKL